MPDPSVVFQGALAFLAGYAVFGDHLVALHQEWRKARVQPDNIACAYFRELGDALSNVHAELAKKKVPRIDGTRLNTLVHAFAQKTAKVKGEKISPFPPSCTRGGSDAGNRSGGAHAVATVCPSITGPRRFSTG